MITPSPFFSNFVQPSLPIAFILQPHCSFRFLVFLAEWVIVPHLMCHLIILRIYICYLQIYIYLNIRRTLLNVLCNKASSLLRSNTCAFCWYSDLISQTQRHTAHSGANRLTHPYKYILTPLVMCSKKLSVCITLSDSLYQKFTFHVFSFQKLFTCRSHTSVY